MLFVTLKAFIQVFKPCVKNPPQVMTDVVCNAQEKSKQVNLITIASPWHHYSITMATSA